MYTKTPATAQIHFPGRWLRLVWFCAAILAVGVLIASLPGYARSISDGSFDPYSKYIHEKFLVEKTPLFIFTNIFIGLLSLFTAIISIILGWVLFKQRSNDSMAVYLSFYLMAYGIILSSPLLMLEYFLPNMAFTVSSIISLLVLGPGSTALILLIPDGRFEFPWTRWLIPFSALIIPLSLSLADSPPTIAEEPWLWGAMLTGSSAIFAAFFILLYRYRKMLTQVQKQQVKWVIFGLTLWMLLQLLPGLPDHLLQSLPDGSPLPWWWPTGNIIYAVALSILPISLTIAVMRYRLYDIDIIINRTLVYGVLTATTIGLYVLVVGVVSREIQSNSSMVSALLTTIVVIILFRPLRNGLQRGVDRLMAGKGKDTFPSVSRAQSDKTRIKEPETAPVPLLGFWLRLTRLAWYPTAILALGILVLSLPEYYRVFSEGYASSTVVIEKSLANTFLNSLTVIFPIMTSVLAIILSWILHKNKSDDRMAVFVSYLFLFSAFIATGPLEMLQSVWPEVVPILFSVLAWLMGPPSIAFLALFPNGRFVPRWTRWLLFASFLISILQIAFSNPTAVINHKFSWVNFLPGIALFGPAFFAQVYRYRYVSSSEQRQQTKWVVYALSFFIITQMILIPIGSSSHGWKIPNLLIWQFCTMLIFVSLTIAIMRYHLYDIDIIINRTLVYGTLTAIIMGIYVIAVGYLSKIFQEQNRSILTLLSTGLIALLFQPLRERLQRIINRLMFGERSDPVSVLSKLGKQLEETVSPQDALSGTVMTIAQTLKLPYIAIDFRDGKKAQVIASYGQTSEDTTQFPIMYQGQNIGRMVVGKRSPGESFSDKDNILLENIARQAGTAAQAAKLTADLQRSRHRLVTTREEERRRLRRDLHDGIGPTMAGQTLKLDAAIDLILGDTETGQKPDLQEAVKMLTELKEQSQDNVKNIRQIVYALRPPSLDVLGLVAAIRVYIDQITGSKHGLKISIENFPKDLPPLSAAVEVAAYRIVLEALTNVINHAQAQECKIKLSVSEREPRVLSLEITDDGQGLSDSFRSGVGLTSMRERTEELDGIFSIKPRQTRGVRVFAQIPLTQMEDEK